MKWNNWRKGKEPYVPQPKKIHTRADRPDNWTICCWYVYLEERCEINLVNLEAGGFPFVYVQLSSKPDTLSEQQQKFVRELKQISHYVRWYNTHFFNNDEEAVMFKLLGA